MIHSRHCTLCENEVKSLEHGVICNLTGNKPNFQDICPDIKLENRFKAKLEDANLELEKLNRDKKRVYLRFFALSVIGFIFIVGNKLFAELMFNEIYYWVHRVGAVALGITVLMIAYQGLNKFRSKLKTAEFNKVKIDTVVSKYGISYRSNFEYSEKTHGIQHLMVTIEFEGWTKNTPQQRL